MRIVRLVAGRFPESVPAAMLHSRPLPPRRQPIGFIGLLLVSVALAMQLAATGVVPFATLAAGVDRLVAASICHADSAADDPGGAPVHRHVPECAVCPLCQVIAHAGVLLAAPGFGFAAPALLAFRSFAMPPARAPPGRAASATSARGPPARF